MKKMTQKSKQDFIEKLLIRKLPSFILGLSILSLPFPSAAFGATQHKAKTKSHSSSEFSNKLFLDQDLQKHLKKSALKKTQGLIYAWSPHMPLSVRGVKEAEKLARDKKLSLLVLLDPYAEQKMSERVATQEKFPKSYTRRLESRQLLEKDMSLHYPSLILFKNGVLAERMRGGYDEPQRLSAYMEKELGKIRGPASVLPGLPFRGLFGFQASAAVESKLPPAIAMTTMKQEPIESVCQFAPLGVKRRTAPRRGTSYFFRSFPNSNFVSYAGVDDPDLDSNPQSSSANHNYILNLDTRKEYKLQGPYDPVPICEEIMTVPNGSVMDILSIKKILRNDQDPKIAQIGLGGVYQSVTACPKNGKGEIKLITDLDKVSMVTLKIDLTGENPTVEQVGPAKKICTNQDIKFPMLSKNGKEISGRDETSGSSKIWTIEEDGTCTETFNFGFLLGNSDPNAKLLVGKADFSFDGKKMTFHVRSDSDNGSYFQKPSQSMAMNIYVYDRVQKTVKKLTNNYDRNSYYPVFKEDGSIVYMDMTRGNHISFIWLDPDPSPSTTIDQDWDETTQASEFRRYQSLMTIGRTWYEFCANPQLPLQADAAVLTALSLDSTECQELMKKNWEPLKQSIIQKGLLDKSSRGMRYGISNQIENLKADDLIKYCPDESHLIKDLEVVGLEDTIIQSAQGIIQSKCISCHTDADHPFADTAALTKNLPLVEKMKYRIFDAEPAKRMPLVGTLTDREKDKIKNYLDSILNQAIRSPDPAAQGVLAQGYTLRKIRVRRWKPKLPSTDGIPADADKPRRAPRPAN